MVWERGKFQLCFIFHLYQEVFQGSVWAALTKQGSNYTKFKLNDPCGVHSQDVQKPGHRNSAFPELTTLGEYKHEKI